MLTKFSLSLSLSLSHTHTYTHTHTHTRLCSLTCDDVQHTVNHLVCALAHSLFLFFSTFLRHSGEIITVVRFLNFICSIWVLICIAWHIRVLLCVCSVSGGGWEWDTLARLWPLIPPLIHSALLYCTNVAWIYNKRFATAL
jgi:hypothetical protein